MEKCKLIKKGKNESNRNMRKLLFKNNNNAINNSRLKTTYNNLTKTYNLKLINKKNENKREEILNTLNNQKSYLHYQRDGLPRISIQKDISNSISPKKKKNISNKYSVYVPNFDSIIDKEGLIAQLYYISNDMDNQNKEIEYLKKDYNNLINNSLAYKIIIEKILDLDENGNYSNQPTLTNNLKKREKSKSENNFKIIKSIDEKEELIRKEGVNEQKKQLKNIINNNSYITKKYKNQYIIKNMNVNDKENQTKINVLLNQKIKLNKIYLEKERNLIKIKKNEKNIKFDEYLSLINNKNIELEELVEKSRKLQYQRYDKDNQINLYLIKIKKINDEINTTSEKIKSNKNELSNYLIDIENLSKLIEELKQKEILLNEDEKQNQNNLKEKIEKENKLDNLIKEKQNYFQEKQKIEAQIKDLEKKEDISKKVIDRKNLTIKGLNIENKDLSKQINYYEERRTKLLEKADQPRKNRLKMKEMENEIKNLEKNIVTYKVENDEKEKNMEDTIEKNNEHIVNQEEEINGHPSIIQDLNKEINNLKNELIQLEKDNKNKGEELSKIENEFKNKKEESKMEKENKEKLKKEKELEENNERQLKEKQNEEKINNYLKNKEELSKELEKVKEENKIIQEKNSNLKKVYKEKMELYKLAKEKQLKFQSLLNEIKELSNKS